jgi:hypothetical protein
MNTKLLALAVLCSLTQPSYAVDSMYVANVCHPNEDARINEIYSSLKDTETHLPNVPPEQEKYISAEQQRATTIELKGGDES